MQRDRVARRTVPSLTRAHPRGTRTPSILPRKINLPPEPRQEVIIPPTRKNAAPEHKLSGIDNNTQQVNLAGLEQDRQERQDVPRGVDGDKDERDAADGAVEVNVPVVPQHTRGE